MVVLVEEDNSLGCEVVDADDLCGLHVVGVTSLTGICLLKMRVSR